MTTRRIVSRKHSAEPGFAAKNLLITLVLLAAVAVAIVALLTMDPRGTRGPRTGSRYVEEVRAKASVDPALIAWNESASPMAVPMDSPRALAVDAQDRVYVIGDRLVILTSAGEPVLRSDELTADYRALAIDGRGRIVAAARNRVDVIDASDSEIKVVRSVGITGDGVDLTAVAVSQAGIFAADAGLCRICRIGLDDEGEGAPFEVIADGLFVPSTMDLTISPAGELTTVDPGRHRVQVRDGYGDVVSAFGERGGKLSDFHGCCNPIAIAVMPGKQVVTAEKGLATTRVKVYESGGELDSVVAGPASFDHRPDGPPIFLDVAVDSKGRILVLDPSRKQVRVFTRKAR